MRAGHACEMYSIVLQPCPETFQVPTCMEATALHSIVFPPPISLTIPPSLSLPVSILLLFSFPPSFFTCHTLPYILLCSLPPLAPAIESMDNGKSRQGQGRVVTSTFLLWPNTSTIMQATQTYFPRLNILSLDPRPSLICVLIVCGESFLPTHN